MIFVKILWDLNHSSLYILDSPLHIKLFNTSTCNVWYCSSIHLFLDYLFIWISTLFWTCETVP